MFCRLLSTKGAPVVLIDQCSKFVRTGGERISLVWRVRMGVPSTCTIIAGENAQKKVVGRLAEGAGGSRQVRKCPALC